MHLPKFEECECPPLDLLKISLCHQPLFDDLQNPQSSQEYFCRKLQELVQCFRQKKITSKVMLGPQHNRNTYSRPRKVFRSCSLCKGHFTIWSRQYPEKIEIGFSVVTGLQVSCKDVQNQALNQMLIHYHPIHVGPSTPWANINSVL
jgi:hypothetical protein